MPQLHQGSPRPYYLLAPAYRRSSAGIRVMHMLCHLLNRCGQDAWMFPTETNPMWHTPLLNDALRKQHLDAGRQPIVIYPEVVRGNPAGAQSVVRYLLNVPGLLGGDASFADTDLIFAYGKSLLPAGLGDDHIMFMPPIDTSLFNNHDNPLDQRRKGWLIYPGRHTEALRLHPQLAAKCTVITNQWPASPKEMAELFRRSERVYCFSSTSIALEAMLCGCPAVVLKSPFFDGVPIGIGEFGTHGLAFDDAPQAIAEAVAGLPVVERIYSELQDSFWQQLEVFISKTQSIPVLPRLGGALSPSAVGNTTHATRAERSLAVQQWLRQRAPGQAQATLMAERLQRYAQHAPRFVFVILPQGQPEAVELTRQSLQEQGYPFIEDYLASDAQADTLNEIACNASQGQWLCFVEAGTTFTAFGLSLMALDLLDAVGVRALYADELTRNASGELDALLRPDFNLDLLLSVPADMARHWFFLREVFIEAGGFQADCAGALELGLLLRLIEGDDGLGGLAHVSEPVLISVCTGPVHNPQEQAVLEQHLRRRGYLDSRVVMHRPGVQRVYYGHQSQPLVSIIIDIGERFDRLQRCVTSLREKTAYPNYEILLLDGTAADPASHAWLDSPGMQQASGITVLRGQQGVDANLAAERAAGEYVVLLHSASVIADGSWLEALLNHAQRPEVGVVGGKLLNPDGRVAQAGLVLGLNGPAGLAFAAQEGTAHYLQRDQAEQNLSAVSGACLMIRRSLYQEVGGLELSRFSADSAAIDLCLKVRQQGYLTVWTPHAVLMVDGQFDHASSAAFEATAGHGGLYDKWLPLLAQDPAYNRNLSLSGPDFALETDPGLVRPPLSWRPLPVVLAMPASESAAGSRIIDCGLSMNISGTADVHLAMRQYSPAELARLRADSWVVQLPETDELATALLGSAGHSNAFKVLEADAACLEDAQATVVLQRMMSVVDRVVVATDALAHALREYRCGADIRVVPDSLHPARWGALPVARPRPALRPRVGWVAGCENSTEQALLAQILCALADEVDWICLGPCAQQLKPYLREQHELPAADQYAGTLSALDLDLALAPALGGVFDHCRSNLQLLQLGACGFAVVCSEVLPWQGLPVTPVGDDPAQWIEAIGMHLADREACAARGEALRQAVVGQWLLDPARLNQRLDAWCAP